MDGKEYNFQTLSILEQLGVRKLEGKLEKLRDEQDLINFKSSNKVLLKDENNKPIPKDSFTDEDREQLYENEYNQINLMMQIIRKSICKKHPEFAISKVEADEAKIEETLLSLLDTPDLRILSSFVTSGNYVPEETMFKQIVTFKLDDDAAE